MFYGYARCSTNAEKQDLDRQVRELKEAGATLFFQEYEHGDAATKEEQEKLFDLMTAGDTLIVCEVSRLSRSTQQLCQIIERVREKQIRLIILNSITIDCRNGELDPMTEAFLKMAGVFGELELKMIRARVKSGIANAKEKGTRSGKPIGRPTATADDIPAAFYKHYPSYKAGALNKTEFARVTGLSRPTIDKYLGIVEQKAG